MKRFILRDILYVLKSRIHMRQKLKTSKIGARFLLLTLTIFFMLWLSFSIFETRIKPTVLAMSENRAKYIATKAINEGINEVLLRDIKYDDLIEIKKDDLNKVTALQVNIVKLNEMQAMASNIILDKITKVESNDLKIPVGNIFNSTILAGWGPIIRIKIIPIGTVQTKFIDQFETAGINQTKHKISLQITSSIAVIVPLMSVSTEVATSVPVAETIIVGGIPNTFIDVSDASEAEISKSKGIIENFATE